MRRTQLDRHTVPRSSQKAMSHRGRAGALMAGVLAAMFGVAACGTDVPSGPMDETELETVAMTGRDVPEGWDLAEGPASSDRYGDEIDEIAPGQAGSTGVSDCVQAQESANEATQDLAYVAESEAGYTRGDAAYAAMYMFSTDDERDLLDSIVYFMESCTDLALEGMGLGWDQATTEMDIPDVDMNGVKMVNDSAGDGGAVVFAGQSYGQNHLMVMGISQDAREEENLEEFVDAAQERFEQGPNSSEDG